MKIIQIFENVTRAKLKDCIDSERLMFIVEEIDIGKAVGKGGVNIKKLENMFKKKVVVIAFNNDVVRFVSNLLYPIKPKDVRKEENQVIIEGYDTKSKGLIIGRDKKNLNNIISIVKRYFDIEGIKVV